MHKKQIIKCTIFWNNALKILCSHSMMKEITSKTTPMTDSRSTSVKTDAGFSA